VLGAKIDVRKLDNWHRRFVAVGVSKDNCPKTRAGMVAALGLPKDATDHDIDNEFDGLKARLELKRAVASNDQQKQSGQRTAKRTTKKTLVPQNPQVVAFLNRLNRDLGSDDYPTKKSIAMDITGQNERKAMNLLRQARRFSDLLRADK